MPRHGGPHLQIGEVAERTGLSLRTLRHYDEIGLITPSARTPGGFRLYTEQDVARLLVIRRMKPLGYTLDAMHEVMRLLQATGPTDTDAWAEVLNSARQRREELTRQVAMADEFLMHLHKRFDERPDDT